MVSKFNIYTVHLKCLDSIRYHLNQYKTLTKNFNRTRTYVRTYTVKAICPHGDYRPRGHNYDKADYYTIKNELNEAEWINNIQNNQEDINKQWELFTTKINN